MRKTFAVLLSLFLTICCCTTTLFVVKANENDGDYIKLPDEEPTKGTSSKINIKIEWEISTIDISFDQNYVWSPIKLEWIKAEPENISVNPVQAIFTFKNIGTETARVDVGFNAETTLEETLSKVNYENNKSGGRIVSTSDDGYNYEIENDILVITASLEFNNDKLAKLDETEESKYGTYVVSLTSLNKFQINNSFNAEAYTFYFEDDMSWKEWIDSEYNWWDVKYIGDIVYYNVQETYISLNTYMVSVNDKIIADTNYEVYGILD